ncbi:MAG TPA: DUF4013 domain-containing protein [bacterium]|nr:DUF4013 domain-containing protein [bacterium]
MENANPPPPPPSGGIQFIQAFRFLFDQPNALINILLAAVMQIIPIVGGIVLMGWYCEIIQRLIKRHPSPIPKLDFGDFVYWLGRGVVPFLVVFLLTLPLTLVIMVVVFAGMFGGGILMASLQRSGAEPSPLFLFGGIGLMALIILAIILPMNVLLMSALLRAELTEDFGKALQLGKIWNFACRTWKDFVVVYIVVTPVFLVMMFAGMLFLFVGMYLVIVMLNFTYLHLRWQIYERYLRSGGEPIPLQTKSGPIPSETPKAAPPLPTPAPQG